MLRRYRYYITNPKHTGRDRPPPRRMPAHDLEATIAGELAAFLGNPSEIMSALTPANLDAAQLDIAMASSTADSLGSTTTTQAARPILLRRVERIDLNDAGLTITVIVAHGITHMLTATVAKVRRGSDVRLVVRGPGCDASDRDEQLVTLIADAHAARTSMLAQPDLSLEQLATAADIGLARFRRLLRLSFLAPDIIQAIIDGRQPATLTAPYLNTITHIPLGWAEQRAELGFTLTGHITPG